MKKYTAPLSKLLIVTLLSAAPFSLLPAASPKETLSRIADRAGLADFDSVDSIAYTFNAEIGDQAISRAWVWEPKKKKVTYQQGTDEAVTYLRSEVAEGSPNVGTDQKFINDLYWLIFPFQVAWDASVTLETIEANHFTAGIEAAGGLKVSYPDGVGYTPGDVYEIYYNADDLVTAWVFRKGGSATPSRITTWEDYAEFGPLSLSLNRPAPAGGFRIFFTDVSVVSQ